MRGEPTASPPSASMHGVDSLNVSVSAAIVLYEARRQRDALWTRHTDGHGLDVRRSSSVPDRAARRPHTRRAPSAPPSRSSTASGSAAARPHIGCLPSKALLHAAAEHRANPPRYECARRSIDFTINRPADAAEPDDSIHVSALDKDGAVVYRGDVLSSGRLVSVSHDGARHELTARDVVIAVGSNSRPIRIPGIEKIDVWTNEQATLTRELPRSLLILGGGPTGCELAQVYARFGVPVTIVQSGPRLAPTDHPRNSDVVRATLENDGVKIRTGVRAIAARAGAGQDGAHVIDLDDGSTASGHVLLAAIGREVPLDDLGLEHYGLDTSGRTPPYRATGGCASPRGCMRWAMQAGQSSTRIRRITRASWPRG